MKLHIRHIFSVLFVLLAFLPNAAFSGTCDCDISPRKVEAYDALLNLDSTEQAEAVYTHLPWGVPANPPTSTNEHLLYQTHYIIDYDDDLKVPIWVAYRLRAQEVEAGLERTECFRNDPRLPQDDAAFCADYDEPIFDRGHLVPNADMTRDESAMINTYMFSNMTPQYGNFNRIIWSRLEGFVRDWAKVKGEIYVITGAVFDKNNDGHRDKDNQALLVKSTNRVAIPTHFYKIILHERPDGSIESMTFLLPHDDIKHTGREGERYLENNLTSIDNIEARTGIDFLPKLSEINSAKEGGIEKYISEKMWQRK